MSSETIDGVSEGDESDSFKPVESEDENNEMDVNEDLEDDDVDLKKKKRQKTAKGDHRAMVFSQRTITAKHSILSDSGKGKRKAEESDQ